MSIEESRQAGWSSGRIVPALVVIAIGAFFLLRNLGIDIPFFDFANWWAWLILAAAVVPLLRAVERYRRVGGVDGDVLQSLLTCAVIVLVALMFILGLSWGRWWPLFVIYGGLCMLVRSPHRDRSSDSR